MILGEDAILSTTRTISYVSGSKFPSGGKCTAGKISEKMSCKQLVMSDVDIANASHIMYRVVSQWSFYGEVIIKTIETDRSRSMSQKLIWIYFDLNSHNYPLLLLLIVLDIHNASFLYHWTVGSICKSNYILFSVRHSFSNLYQTIGYCIANKNAEPLIGKIEEHLKLCNNEATDFQCEILATQMPSMLQRIHDA